MTTSSIRSTEANQPTIKAIYVDFKWNGGKKEKAKPVTLTVVREYAGGAVQVASGDVYQTTTEHNHKDKAFYLATA